MHFNTSQNGICHSQLANRQHTIPGIGHSPYADEFKCVFTVVNAKWFYLLLFLILLTVFSHSPLDIHVLT